MREIARQFSAGQMYDEKEVNKIIAAIFDDYVKVRQYLILNKSNFLKKTYRHVEKDAL